MLSTVTSKGQVTIPKPIRDALSINPSDKVDFIQENGKVFILPVKTLKDFRGAVKSGGAGSFPRERSKAKRSVGKRVIGETA